MRKKVLSLIKYNAILLIFSILGSLAFHHMVALASSATVYFTSETPETTVGGKVSVVITVESSAIVSTVEAYIAYDPTILEFKTGGKLVSGSDGLIKISDIKNVKENEVKKYSISFVGLKEGACEVGLSDIPTICDANGEEMSLSNNRISIAVRKPNKSKDNKLASLEISPGELVPPFQSDILEYETTLPFDSKKLFFSTKTNQSDAEVEIIGADDLQIGKNFINVRVIAASGDVREYKITADRPAEEPKETNTPEQEIGEITKEQIASLFSVAQEDGTIWIQGGFRYQIKEAPDEALIPKGYIKTKLILYGVNIPAYTLKNDLENDFLLLYAMNNEEEGFYQYDRLEKTLQRYQEKEVNSETANIISGKITSSEKYNQKVEQLSFVIAILCGLTVLLLIEIIRLFLKQRGYQDEDED